MSQYRLDERAEQDLDDIWLRIAEDNPDAADRMIDRLVDLFILLAGQPLMGRERPKLSLHVRSFAVGNYVIFYRPSTDGVDIAGVVHGSRGINTLFRNWYAHPYCTLEKISEAREPVCRTSYWPPQQETRRHEKQGPLYTTKLWEKSC